MKPIEKEYDVGVIIGRFQINELHEAHTALIEHVISNHKKVLIMLGVSPLLSTKSNPLDYVARVHMIQEKYPDVILLPLKDYSNDDVWSAVVDGNVDSVAHGKSVVLLNPTPESTILVN
jgi:bifunctional NMN adenylyltransferase/nudix hydrolase